MKDLHPPTPPAHTPEPWDPRGYSPRSPGVFLETQDGLTIAEFIRVVDRDRAQNCVNALAGIPDPAAFVARAKRIETEARNLASLTSLAVYRGIGTKHSVSAEELGDAINKVEIACRSNP